ncbi:MAG: J domain-containing protein [Taibaiella sp.]|jgi:hypothetical protein
MQAYPLQWPLGYERSKKRISSRFKQTMGSAQNQLHAEVKKLCGSQFKSNDLIVSTNMRVRQDGLIYAADLAKKIDDPGVAIYFKYRGQDTSMCCDQYERIWENMYALAMAIDALRSIDRWGVSDFLKKAFTGFAALPEPGESSWPSVLRIATTATKQEIIDAYRNLCKIHHPDVGGDRDEFQKITTAYKEALTHCNER